MWTKQFHHIGEYLSAKWYKSSAVTVLSSHSLSGQDILQSEDEVLLNTLYKLKSIPLMFGIIWLEAWLQYSSCN